MDRATIIGISAENIAIGVGMYLKGISFLALFNPAALLIIFLGIAASVLIAFPMSTIKKVPKLLKVIFSEKDDQDIGELIALFSKWANQSRREGVLSLENHLNEIEGVKVAEEMAELLLTDPPHQIIVSGHADD